MNIFKKLKLLKLLKYKKARVKEFEGVPYKTLTIKTNDTEFISLLSELMGKRIKHEIIRKDKKVKKKETI